MSDAVYHVCTRAVWEAGKAKGAYDGSIADRTNGYIHLSAAEELAETLATHFAGREGLVLLTLHVEQIEDSLVWEQSRHGALFPHLHGQLPVDAVVSVVDLRLDEEGRHVLPADLQ